MAAERRAPLEGGEEGGEGEAGAEEEAEEGVVAPPLACLEKKLDWWYRDRGKRTKERRDREQVNPVRQILFY